MGYKIIDNYADARRLYDEGLLCYALIRPDGSYSPYKHPVPYWWEPIPDRFEFESSCRYAVYLEE